MADYSFPVRRDQYLNKSAMAQQAGAFNAMSDPQRSQYARLINAQAQGRTNAGWGAYNDAGVGMDGAGSFTYNAMRHNAERGYDKSPMGVMNQIMQQQLQNQAMQPAAGPSLEEQAYNAGQEAWNNWKDPTAQYDQEVQALYANSPQANPQAAMAGRVAAPARFAGATGIYSRV